jgi:hypothetical protein
MSAMTRMAVVSAIAVSSAFLLDGVRPGGRVEARAATATVQIFPEDASINVNNTNTSRDARLMTYTWPDRRPANAIVLKFDLSGLPAGAVVENAALRLALIESDRRAETVYTITAHKIVGRNPLISRVTGYTADGTQAWTPNACCYNGVPLAQADISLPYDTRPVDKIRGDKTWNLTAMVREWLAEPATNFGVLLNSDRTIRKDRYRFFASMEHTTAALRPYLRVTYSLPPGDLVPPSVSLTSPLPGATLSGVSRLEASATDDTGVAGVRFYMDGAPAGDEIVAAPYAWDLDTSAFEDGPHTLTAVARDAAGNIGTAVPVAVTTSNGRLRVAPADTSLNLDDVNYSTSPNLFTYTWPDRQTANAIVLTFDLSSVPADAVIDEATLNLALVASDSAPEAYSIAAHKIVGRNPAVGAATGYSADGVIAWTPSACCHNGVPLAQADISMAYDTRAIDTTAGFKAWAITPIVQDWVRDPASNFGLLLNSDATALRDRYRYFASMEHPDTALRPFLQIRYSRPAEDTTPPAISLVAASNLAPSSALIAWTTNEASDSQVEYGTATAYGSTTPVQGTLLTAHAVLLTGLRDATQYYYRVRSRDAAGNVATSPMGTFTTPAAPDTTAPSVSLTAPAAGATVSGTIAVTASAADNAGVAGVQFLLDGANLGAEDTAAPYSASWNTANTPDGSHTLTAVARDAAGNTKTSAAVTVTVLNVVTPPPAPAGWPNEPAGYSVIEETGWEAGTLGNWYRIFTSSDKPISVKSIAGSPIGESKALQLDYLQGHVGGGGTELRYDIPSAQRSNELYVGFYVQVNPQWQGHSSGINKMVYLHDGGSDFAAMWYEMFGSGSNPLDLYVVNQSGSSPSGFRENVNQITFARGQWHRVEIYQKQGASNNGVVRVWVDGVLAIDRSDIDTRSAPVDNITISGIWGGVGDSKNQADYMRFDRIRISRPGSGTSEPPPPPAGGTILFEEGFEDGNLAGRGWYDSTTPLLSTAEHVAGSTRSIEFRFDAGATTPTAARTLRHKFAPGDSVYLGYWVKYSSNWVGSQRAYHPHEFHVLTTRDGDWSGLSFNRLTVYVEQNGGTPLVGIQDGANVDQSRVGQDLTAVTEDRGVAGCNGSTDGYPDNCYMGGSGYVNEKKWKAPARYFTDATGAYYKADWHFVEAYVRLNSIADGRGVPDGVVRYWFDGQLIIDRGDVLLRTGANPTMQFNQLVVAPYIGDGSPVTQSMWVDNLTVATARP